VVLGGDCTITLGVLAGVQRHAPDAGLLYFDGDADLATPATTSSGVLDAMGAAHLLGLADNPLARLGPHFPMLLSRTTGWVCRWPWRRGCCPSSIGCPGFWLPSSPR